MAYTISPAYSVISRGSFLMKQTPPAANGLFARAAKVCYAGFCRNAPSPRCLSSLAVASGGAGFVFS